MTDIQYASGAIRDDAGPITSFVGISERGKAWMRDWSGGFEAGQIETNEVPLMVSCIENDDLSVQCLTR